jgi:hypothetical protein
MTAVVVATAPTDQTLQRLRLSLRVPVFTATTVALGVVAHVAAGGGPPSAGQVLVVLAAVGLTSALRTRRERTLPTIVLAVTLVQLGMHAALPMGSEHNHAAMTETMPVTPPMLLAHAGAVLALSWWLRRGEMAAWRVLGEVWGRLVRPRVVPQPSNEVRRPLPAGPRRVGRRRLLAPVITVRGPPRSPA